MPSLSVVIRNRNEAAQLGLVLDRLARQRTAPLEVIVVDNDSTDDSRQVIADHGATLVHLPAGEFTYGRATNLGLSHARGELVLMLSAHSLPVGTFFVDEVTAPFDNPRVAAVRIPIAANTRELSEVEQRAPLDRSSSPAEIFARGPVASGSVIRRSVWEQWRVDETLDAAEDKDWALRVLRGGNWIMPTVDACYVYAKSYTRAQWVRKVQREEAAGFKTAGVRRTAGWPQVAKTAVSGLLDTWNRTLTEAELTRARRGLR